MLNFAETCFYFWGGYCLLFFALFFLWWMSEFVNLHMGWSYYVLGFWGDTGNGVCSFFFLFRFLYSFISRRSSIKNESQLKALRIFDQQCPSNC